MAAKNSRKGKKGGRRKPIKGKRKPVPHSRKRKPKPRKQRAPRFKLPEGYESIEVWLRSRIAEQLTAFDTIGKAQGISGQTQTFLNRDDSITGQYTFPFDTDIIRPRRFVNALEQVSVPIAGAWVSIGFRYKPSDLEGEEEGETLYRRYKGRVQIRTHYRKASRIIFPHVFQRAYSFLDRVAKRHGVAPAQGFIRFYWHPSGRRPKRGKTGD